MENEDEKPGQDVEMPDSSAVDDDEGDDGEGDDGDDDEGEESGTPAENEDQDMDDAPALPTSSSVADATLTPTPDVPAETGSSLAPPAAAALNTDIARVEGSPLKNFMLRSPTRATSQIYPMATSEIPDVPEPEPAAGLGTGLEPSPIDSQSRQPSAPRLMEETSVEKSEPQAAPVSEEAVVAENAGAVMETAAEVTSGAVATTSIEEPEGVSAPVAEPQPSEDVSEAVLAVTDTTIPTSEDPKAKTGEAPEAGDAAPLPEATLPDSTSAEGPAAPVASSHLGPLDLAPATQAMTEDGTDDGSDILGALGARLDAEEDVPPPTSAPTIPASQLPTKPRTHAEEASED